MIRRPESSDPNPPGAVGVATRIVTCVNAGAGIADPVQSLREPRKPPLPLASSRADADDQVITSVRSRLHPQERSNAVGATGGHE